MIKRVNGTTSRTKVAAIGVVLASAAEVAHSISTGGDVIGGIVTGLIGIMGYFLRDTMR